MLRGNGADVGIIDALFQSIVVEDKVQSTGNLLHN
jgi:hypothetical protein